MKELEERIRKEGKVLPGSILKVDSFLNHQIDALFMDRMAAEIHEAFKKDRIDRIMTVEPSGIALAQCTAMHFRVPYVFAKKAVSGNIGSDVYVSHAYSYTYGRDYEMVVSKKYVHAGERVLLVDDFLADGRAMRAMIDLCEQAGAEVAGICACIEKGFQDGGRKLREDGYRVYSLAIVQEMSEEGIRFA
jgi:xanthine phosphoribosyltransferase